MKATSSRRILFFAIAFIALSVPCWGQTQYWTGDGGKGMSLGIIVPESQGLSADTAYLPTMVQGVLVANFTKYSAISVLDRVAMDKVIMETLNPAYKDNLDIIRVGNVAQVGNMMTGKIIKTSSGYSLQINITDTTPAAKTIAAYSGTCTTAQLDDQTAIQKASQELLTQVGVKLTASAISELGRTNSQQVSSQTALARGITAQKQGTEVVALSYFFQAADFDPALVEAKNRSSILAANISSGNIGDDARNDIQWRKDWENRLKETEQYFNSYFDNFFKTSSLPYTMVYSAKIKQGAINYQAETVTIEGMETVLHASSSWAPSVDPIFKAMRSSVQAVQSGLIKTGRAATWGLDKWPQQGSFNVKSFGNQNRNFTIVAELVNDRNQVIGRQTFTTVGKYELPVPLPGNKAQKIQISADVKKSVSFPNVRANDITDNLTVRIASVNGVVAETAARNGILQIRTLSEDFETIAELFDNGTIPRYNKTGGALVIPSVLMGEPVTSIGNLAFTRKALTSVTIPNSVTNIGESAFSHNQLTSIVIPDSVVSIGASAFSYNQLTDVVIPDSVTGIGVEAFLENSLTSVIIPGSVAYIGYGAFAKNSLASVTIPNSVTIIGNEAFSENQLTSVIVPESVTIIGAYAFSSNQVSTITIGANVEVEEELSMSYGPQWQKYRKDSYRLFATFYNKNGKKAGVYTCKNNKWSYKK